jgi:spermidine synthase
LLITIAFLTGLSSFIYEIVWIRMLALVLGSSNDAFELMLASFILGIALGGLWVRRRIDTTADPARFLGYVQIFMGLFALATIPFYNMSFDAMAWMLSALGHEDSSYFLFNVGSALIAMAMMLPATFMAGMTLPLLTYLLLRRGAGERSIGIIYSANTLGSIGGVLLGIHIGLPLLGVQNSLKFACLIDVVLGTAILLSIKSGREATSRWVAVTSVVTIVACITLAIDPLRSASGVFRLGSATLSGSERIEFHRDGKTATVDTIRSSSGVVSIRTNGKTDAGIQMRRAGRKPSPDEFTMMLAAVLPLAYKPDIASAAVIGFGSGLTTATLLASPNVRRVDTVEIEPAIVEGARLFLPRVERAYFDPRSRIIFDDAKSFFARSKGSYDLIVSEPSNPWVSGTASLFTEEFYVRIRGYLNEDGLFVQWIQAYEFNPRLFASIVNALGSTFPAFIMYGNGTDLMIVASKNGHLGEPSHRIFEWKQLASDLEPLGIVSLRDLRSRKIASRQVMERLLAAERAPANSDYFPYVEMYAPRARFRQENAIFVLALASGPIPVIEMMERWPAGPSERASAPPDSTLARQLSARAADRYIDFLDDSRPGAAEAVPADLDAPLIAAYRMALVDCVSLENTAALWDQVIRLGEIIGSSGDPETGQRFWRTAEESRCLTKLPSYYRDWIALLGSVSARDPVRTEQLAESLLEFRDKTYSQIEYLILASAAGRLAQGKTELARATVNEAFKALLPDRRKLPRFEMIRRLAGE